MVLDRNTVKGRSLVYVARQAIAGGADIIQLRDKDGSDREILETGRAIKKITLKRRAVFIINDRADIAKVIDADGVHLGQDDLPIEAARSIMRRDKIIGVSTHSLSQALKAQKDGADYIGVGPIFSTPTKPDYKAVGLTLIKIIKDKVKIPFVAIGGIDESNVDDVILAGARRIAVVRAVCSAKDIRTHAGRLKKRLEDI